MQVGASRAPPASEGDAGAGCTRGAMSSGWPLGPGVVGGCWGSSGQMLSTLRQTLGILPAPERDHQAGMSAQRANSPAHGVMCLRRCFCFVLPGRQGGPGAGAPPWTLRPGRPPAEWKSLGACSHAPSLVLVLWLLLQLWRSPKEMLQLMHEPAYRGNPLYLLLSPP